MPSFTSPTVVPFLRFHQIEAKLEIIGSASIFECDYTP